MMDRIDVSQFTRRDQRAATLPTQGTKASESKGSMYNAFLGFPVAGMLASIFKRKKRPA